jgi:PAS domain S-box-containing protein
MEGFKNISLKNKMFFSTLAVLLLISVVIASFSRWVLISSLTSELKRRGMGIAQSIAESSRSYILTENIPELTSLLFDARLGERKQLIVYLFILDKKEQVLSHTFTDTFPEKLHMANKIPPEQPHSIKLLRTGEPSVYDIAVPVKEGIYELGTVHVGLNKKHIDQLVGKLRITFIGFVSIVSIIFFGISHWLSKYITRPIFELTTLSDEISRGNFNIKPAIGSEIKCWEINNCEKSDCPAFHNSEIPCWYVDDTLCDEHKTSKLSDKLDSCSDCSVYKRSVKDEVSKLSISFINMTNRIKISQSQMKDSEAKYRSLFSSGPNPIFVLDRNSLEILDANPIAEETYNYTKGELTGKPFTDLGPFEFEDASLVHFEKNGWQKACLVSSRVQYFKKDNKPFYVNVHACPTKYQDRDALIVATTDISDMIEKDTQLIHVSKMKTLGEISAGIAHELNQPLNAFKMGSEYLRIMIEKKREIPEQNLLNVVNEISEQVDRAASIIARLRDFGRKADFSREKVDINKPIKSVVDIVGKQLSLQNIDIDLKIDEGIPPILAHDNRLEQVIFNMITNARDAINQKQEAGMESGNRVISIRSFMEDDRVAVTVSDTGIGIPESDRERIFEAFFTTKEMGEGMGLGLSITNGIVKDYGGDIAIESEEGEGTTIKITFPCAPSVS